MNEDPEQGSARDEQLVRYLLGELPEEEQSRLEELYFADPELYERLVAAKEELIDDYVRGRLAGRMLARFEGHFLASPERRRRVETARAVRAQALSMEGAAPRAETVGVAGPGGLGAATRRNSLFAWWGARPTALRYTVAAVLVAALLCGAWLALLPRRERRGAVPEERAGMQTDERPAEPAASREGGASTRDSEGGALAGAKADAGPAANTAGPTANLQRRGAEGSGAAPRRPAAVAALTLTPVHTRGAGRPNTLFISDGAARVSLRLLFGESRHGRYEALVQTVEGAEVAAARGLESRETAGGQSVQLSLSPALFTRSDYIITLSGLTAEGRPEKVNEYFLQVRRDEPHARPARRTRP